MLLHRHARLRSDDYEDWRRFYFASNDDDDGGDDGGGDDGGATDDGVTDDGVTDDGTGGDPTGGGQDPGGGLGASDRYTVDGDDAGPTSDPTGGSQDPAGGGGGPSGFGGTAGGTGGGGPDTGGGPADTGGGPADTGGGPADTGAGLGATTGAEEGQVTVDREAPAADRGTPAADVAAAADRTGPQSEAAASAALGTDTRFTAGGGAAAGQAPEAGGITTDVAGTLAGATPSSATGTGAPGVGGPAVGGATTAEALAGVDPNVAATLADAPPGTPSGTPPVTSPWSGGSPDFPWSGQNPAATPPGSVDPELDPYTNPFTNPAAPDPYSIPAPPGVPPGGRPPVTRSEQAGNPPGDFSLGSLLGISPANAANAFAPGEEIIPASNQPVTGNQPVTANLGTAQMSATPGIDPATYVSPEQIQAANQQPWTGAGTPAPVAGMPGSLGTRAPNMPGSLGTTGLYAVGAPRGSDLGRASVIDPSGWGASVGNVAAGDYNFDPSSPPNNANVGVSPGRYAAATEGSTYNVGNPPQATGDLANPPEFGRAVTDSPVMEPVDPEAEAPVNPYNLPPDAMLPRDVTPTTSLERLLQEAGTPTVTPDEFGFNPRAAPASAGLGPNAPVAGLGGADVSLLPTQQDPSGGRPYTGPVGGAWGAGPGGEPAPSWLGGPGQEAGTMLRTPTGGVDATTVLRGTGIAGGGGPTGTFPDTSPPAVADNVPLPTADPRGPHLPSGDPILSGPNVSSPLDTADPPFGPGPAPGPAPPPETPAPTPPERVAGPVPANLPGDTTTQEVADQLAAPDSAPAAPDGGELTYGGGGAGGFFPTANTLMQSIPKDGTPPDGNPPAPDGNPPPPVPPLFPPLAPFPNNLEEGLWAPNPGVSPGAVPPGGIPVPPGVAGTLANAVDTGAP